MSTGPRRPTRHHPALRRSPAPRCWLLAIGARRRAAGPAVYPDLSTARPSTTRRAPVADSDPANAEEIATRRHHRDRRRDRRLHAERHDWVVTEAAARDAQPVDRVGRRAAPAWTTASCSCSTATRPAAHATRSTRAPDFDAIVHDAAALEARWSPRTWRPPWTVAIGSARAHGARTGRDPAGVPEAAVPAADRAPPPGPPFPQSELTARSTTSPACCRRTRSSNAEATIDAIEQRTGAEVVVYTQARRPMTCRPRRPRRQGAGADRPVGRRAARASTTGWSSSSTSTRRLEHGQVQLYAGPGLRGRRTCRTRSARRSSRTTCCRTCARPTSTARSPSRMPRIDAAATPEHAATLQAARQANAVVGLVGAPIVFLGSSGWAVLRWRRFGKDPVYLDDPSILMPAPPPDLTAASGAMVMDGRTSRRALTTAMLDLASRGQIAFREEKGMLGATRSASTSNRPAATPSIEAHAFAQCATADRAGRGGRARSDLRRSGTARTTTSQPEDLPKFGPTVAAFDKRARGPRRRRGLVRGEAEQGRRAVGAGEGSWPSSAASPVVGLQRSRLRAGPPGRGGRSPARSSCSSWPRACRPSRCRAR